MPTPAKKKSPDADSAGTSILSADDDEDQQVSGTASKKGQGLDDAFASWGTKGSEVDVDWGASSDAEAPAEQPEHHDEDEDFKPTDMHHSVLKTMDVQAVKTAGKKKKGKGGKKKKVVGKNKDASAKNKDKEEEDDSSSVFSDSSSASSYSSKSEASAGKSTGDAHEDAKTSVQDPLLSAQSAQLAEGAEVVGAGADTVDDATADVVEDEGAPAVSDATTTRTSVAFSESAEVEEIDVEQPGAAEQSLAIEEEQSDQGSVSARPKVGDRKSKWKVRFKSCKAAVKRKWQYVWQRHRRKAILASTIVFIIVLPLLIVWMLLNCMIRLCCRKAFGRKPAEEEEEDDLSQWQSEKTDNQEHQDADPKSRLPERSKLKRPNQFKSFSRKRRLQNDANAEDQSGQHDKASPRTALRNRRKELRNAGMAKSKGKGKRKGKGKGKGRKGEEASDDDFDDHSHAERTRWYQYIKPSHWLAMVHDWRERRKEYFRQIAQICDAIQDEEEYDWDHLDDEGNPLRVVHVLPVSVRRGYRFFLLVYWDPFLEVLDHLPLLLKLVHALVRALPLLAFLASLGWLGHSIWTNAQYREGDCAVHKLPPQYDTTGRVEEQVEGMYWVERSYPGTADRVRGTAVQRCPVTVPCLQMDYGTTNSYDDDRCVKFESWGWGDKIVCFYHKDDPYGTKRPEIYCLSLPSQLQRETFTVVIAGVLLILSSIITGINWWRRRDLTRQTAMSSKEAEAEEGEIAKAKKLIEEREADEARKQRESDAHGSDVAESEADFESHAQQE